MEPRCNHLGNLAEQAYFTIRKKPQWSPGVITWETPTACANCARALLASMEPRCNHLGNEAR